MKAETNLQIAGRIAIKAVTRYLPDESPDVGRGRRCLEFLESQIEVALNAERERCAKILETRADELQAEWDAPSSAQNGFIEMTMDTPAGYATYWGMNNLRKLANQIRGSEMNQNDKVQCGDCGEWIARNSNHTCAKQVKANRRRSR